MYSNMSLAEPKLHASVHHAPGSISRKMAALLSTGCKSHHIPQALPGRAKKHPSAGLLLMHTPGPLWPILRPAFMSMRQDYVQLRRLWATMIFAMM